MIPRPFFIIPLLISLSTRCLAIDEPAWNGYTPPGTANPALFTPYFVPNGAMSYDSASPLVHYKGTWADTYSSRYTTQQGASFSLSFTGTGVEWFGGTGPRHGKADVYIDGQLVQRVDSYAQAEHSQQRLFWEFDLAYQKHTIKVVHAGTMEERARPVVMDIDALVIYMGVAPPQQAPPHQELVHAAAPAQTAAAQDAESPPQGWDLVQDGTTGVAAMQLAIISSSHAIIIDKVEHNPLTVDSGHPAWGALFNLETHGLTALNMKSNSFCAGGSFLSNGTLINVGGNPVSESHTVSANFGQTNGLQGMRVFEPCDAADVSSCDIFDDPKRLRLASPRWYNTVVRIQDGSAIIIGGSKRGGWINNATTNNPTVEYFPPKNIHGANGTPLDLPFLADTLNSNLFPIAFLLPDGRIFIAANRDATIYDWEKNEEERLAQIPNGVRVTYPMTGTGLLLPLAPENDYAPEVLICGGSTLDDTVAAYEHSAKDPASDQCARLLLTRAGIEQGWQVEKMPEPRTMPDAVLLPTGDVVIVNGAGSGISGYGNLRDQVGLSNADAPARTPALYDPAAPVGKRFSRPGLLPESPIPRLYHSTATLTPNGAVMIAGSNPNFDRSEVAYGTEYRVEWLHPPYMNRKRPAIVEAPRAIGCISSPLAWAVVGGRTAEHTRWCCAVSLMDFGYVTHATHTNSRLVWLVAQLGEDGYTLTITGPPHGRVYPPGPGWLHVVVGGVPSKGVKIMVGDGRGPPVDHGAIEK
ncbi:copper radical oxidase [Russula compacta]|nr:copper radical oxidase [Russula compacta]